MQARAAYAHGYKGHDEKASGMGFVNGVEIFSTGYWQGDIYSHADLHSIVNNFNLLQSGSNALFTPPLGVGHTSKIYKDDDGMPKFGKVEVLGYDEVPCRACALRGGLDPKKLCDTCLGTGVQGLLIASFTEVPITIAKLINGRAYDRVSAEIYRVLPEGVPATGMMLRRVVVIGGELPHIKSLKDIPWVDYSEFDDKFMIGKYGTLTVGEGLLSEGGRVFTSFCEVQQMDRNAMINALLKAGLGYEAKFFEGAKDEVVAAAYKSYSESQVANLSTKGRVG